MCVYSVFAVEGGQVGELRKVLKNRHVELFAEVEEGQLRALCVSELPHRLRSRYDCSTVC